MALQCDMDRDCEAEVTHIGNKGFIYCTKHAVRRRHQLTCSERTRQLRKWELRWLREGRPLPSYERLPMPKEQA